MLYSFLTLGLAAAAASASPLRRESPALKVTVSTPADVENADNLYAVVQLTNTGEDAVEINSFNTAFSPLETDDFHVDGSAASGKASEPDFLGPVVRYVTDPAAVRKAGGMIRLAAGESKTVNTTLAARYDFTQSGAGAYSIGTPAVFSVIPGGATEFEIVTATVEPATVNLKGALVSKRNTVELGKRATYRGCSVPEEVDINASVVAAQSWLNTVADSLTATSAAYITWFGAWDAARAAKVRSVYTNLNGVLGKLQYDCNTCTVPGAFAYVYKTQPNEMYLCDLFFEAPSGGANGMMDTLVHEGTHFPAVGNTVDIVYGQAGSQALAKSNPAQAITNADNYAYYFVTFSG